MGGKLQSLDQFIKLTATIKGNAFWQSKVQTVLPTLATYSDMNIKSPFQIGKIPCFVKFFDFDFEKNCLGFGHCIL